MSADAANPKLIQQRRASAIHLARQLVCSFMFDAVFIIYKKIIYVIQQVTVAPTLYPRAIHALPGDVALLEMIRIGPANVPLNAQTATIVAPTTLIYAAELVQQVITLPLSLYLLLGR